MSVEETMELKVRVPESHEEAIVFDGLDKAIIGFGWQFTNPVVIYSREKCIEILAAGMHGEDIQPGEEVELAEEYFEFNVAGAWVGPSTPVFLSDELSFEDPDD